MAVQSVKPHAAPPAQGNLANHAVLWVVPALCALFARPLLGASAVRHARLQAGDNIAQLIQLLAAGGRFWIGTGNALNNRLIGSDYSNILDSEAGDDILDGRDGQRCFARL